MKRTPEVVKIVHKILHGPVYTIVNLKALHEGLHFSHVAWIRLSYKYGQKNCVRRKCSSKTCLYLISSLHTKAWWHVSIYFSDKVLWNITLIIYLLSGLQKSVSICFVIYCSCKFLICQVNCWGEKVNEQGFYQIAQSQLAFVCGLSIAEFLSPLICCQIVM